MRCHVRPAFGLVPLRGLTKLGVQTWVARLEEQGLAPASVAKIYRLLATALAATVDEGLLRQSPCRDPTPPGARPPRDTIDLPSEHAARADEVHEQHPPTIPAQGSRCRDMA